MNKIPMLEKFAAQSLIEYDGELIFSKEKFAQLIVEECSYLADQAHHKATAGKSAGGYIRQHFGVEE